MLLTYSDLLELVADGVINVPLDRIKGASIDVTLGNDFLIEDINGREIDLSTKDRVDPWLPITIANDRCITLAPSEFILAHTYEIFNLPDDIAIEYKLKSSLARDGLDHSLAGWGDPGWHDSVLTLELRNNFRYHSICLRPGMPIGQVVFWRGARVPDSASYRNTGRYNNDKKVQKAK